MLAVFSGDRRVLLVLFAVAYFVPTYVAFYRRRELLLVFVFNLFLGWTGAGYVYAWWRAARDWPDHLQRNWLPPRSTSGRF